MDNIYKSILNERIQQYGISTLTDQEALSVLTGIPLSEMKVALETHGLPELIKYSASMKITKAQSKKLELLYHLAKRISLSNFREKTVLNSSSKAGEYFVKELQFLKNEVFAITLLDAQNRLIKTETIFHGTLNEAPVYPREIVKLVLDNNANSVILGHNHPGGSQHPSSADIEVTKKITAALKTINVAIIDHIIVADNSFTSFAEKGLLNY
ncbi:MAG: DNA repair protein RadC [Thermodesulfovibrionales bacterium]|nr:DNA repair protein RadC [Thermodesulfovibrionales bacterium]